LEAWGILNKTMELKQCRDQWVLDEKHGCYMLEDILYTPAATTPKFQRLSIFVPKHLMNADGTFTEEARKVPVVFENNSAGYHAAALKSSEKPLLRKKYCAAVSGLPKLTCKGRRHRAERFREVNG